MSDQEKLKQLCFDPTKGLKPKDECRASIINYLILEEMVDIDEAEDVADKTLRDLNLWPTQQITEQPPEQKEA